MTLTQKTESRTCRAPTSFSECGSAITEIGRSAELPDDSSYPSGEGSLASVRSGAENCPYGQSYAQCPGRTARSGGDGSAASLVRGREAQDRSREFAGAAPGLGDGASLRDLPLIFHPAATRASAVGDTSWSAARATGEDAEPPNGAASSPVAASVAAKVAGGW